MYCAVILLLLAVLTATRLPRLRQIAPEEAPGVDAARLLEWRGTELMAGKAFVVIALVRFVVGMPIGVMAVYAHNQSALIALIVLETLTLLSVWWVALLSARGQRQRRALALTHLPQALPMPALPLALLMLLLYVLTYLWLGVWRL
jgi:hypothetical protein